MTPEALKIIVVGSAGSGKSTSIRAVSEIPVVGTQAAGSNRQSMQQTETASVTTEYGVVTLEGTKIDVYGTPGQKRFDSVSSPLCKGAAGMLIMISNGGENPLEALDHYLKLHAPFLKQHRAVIGVTHNDESASCTSLSDFHNHCMTRNFNFPVVRLDARERDQVYRTMKVLISEIRRAENLTLQMAG